jgi:hypothetical protein
MKTGLIRKVITVADDEEPLAEHVTALLSEIAGDLEDEGGEVTEVHAERKSGTVKALGVPVGEKGYVEGELKVQFPVKEQDEEQDENGDQND